MKNIYTSGQYLRANPQWHEEDAPWKARQIQKMFLRYRIDAKTVCEVGCGTGMVLEELQKLYEGAFEAIGYDIAPAAIELAKKRQTERLQFVCGDFVSQNKKMFDVILLIDFIEHLENYFEFFRAMKPMSTYKVLHIPLDLSVQSVLRIGTILERRRAVGHIHYFTKEIALEMLHDLDYEVVDSFFTGAAMDLSPKSLKSRLMRLPRKWLFALSPDFAVRLLGGYSLMVLVR